MASNEAHVSVMFNDVRMTILPTIVSTYRLVWHSPKCDIQIIVMFQFMTNNYLVKFNNNFLASYQLQIKIIISVIKIIAYSIVWHWFSICLLGVKFYIVFNEIIGIKIVLFEGKWINYNLCILIHYLNVLSMEVIVSDNHIDYPFVWLTLRREFSSYRILRLWYRWMSSSYDRMVYEKTIRVFKILIRKLNLIINNLDGSSS